ncbi:interferon-induced very large GTPase 1-like [Hemicordylus capensis]|uniref:interferon-induced very large GTPase 1-like n=1 Tax=Hemicordylus capensis TaxID=884348 RepID=UPI002302ED39|nr:interferon-induced very large GTPase 1-like [Hemicordylus capensis]
MQATQEKHLEAGKKRQEQAKEALKELQEMPEKGRPREEEAVRKKEEQLWQAMEIPAEFWAQRPQEPLREVTERMHSQVALPEQAVAGSENLPDNEVLRWASGGLALQGIYQTKELTDFLETREQLIEIPEGFRLLAPSQGSRLEKMEFSSSKQESTFRKVVEQLGLSFGLAAQGSLWGICAETSHDYSRSSEEKGTSESHSEHAYFCTAQYNYIPLASCHFSKDQLRLSSAALQELREIERLSRHVSAKDMGNMLKSRCERFFKRFGSHVKQGPFHFGGIFWWRASAEGIKKEEQQQTKEQISDALSSCVEFSYAGTVGSIALGLKGSKTGSSASSDGAASKRSQTSVQCSVTKTGGPPEVDLLIPWKTGLLASNKTWSVIDQGEQFIPVWDFVLSNHRKGLGDVLKVSKSLRDSYVALTDKKINTSCGEELIVAEEEALAFLEDLKGWKVTGDQDKIVELINFKRNLYEKTKSDRIWINVCLSDPALQRFLEHTVLSYKNSQPPNIKYNRFLLRCLLDPHIYSVSNFSSSSVIMEWIFATEEEQLEDISVTNMVDFIGNLHQRKKSIQETRLSPAVSAAAEQEAKVEVTTYLSSDLCSLLKALKDTSQKDIELLLLSIVWSVGYHTERHFFQYLLGASEIDFMAMELQNVHEKYLALCGQDVYRAQAFLLLMGLTVSVDHKDVPLDEKSRRLAFMNKHMQNSWTKETANVLKKHDINTNWTLLERDLTHLIDGNYEIANDEQQAGHILRELGSIFQENNLTGSSECKVVDSNQDQACSNIQNHEFLNLIKTLELEKYYPNKMQMTDFQLIHKTSLEPRDERELPLCFLEKLLTLDHRVRYLVCKDHTSITQGEAYVPGAMDDDLDFIFGDVSEECHEVMPSALKHIHPMDVQMAMFHCADDFMRQYIATKLSFCQFALPLLVPNPCTSQIEFPLWSFCQVNKKWKCAEIFQEKIKTRKCRDELIYQAVTPVVSFIRMSTSSSSKSQLLNHLLSKQKHNIFFHRNSKGISKNCILMKGMVEIAWYCPGGKDDDAFDTCIAFTNLHGNASEYKQQARFLQEIASVTVVLLSESDWTGDGKTFLGELLKSPQPFIFLCADKEQISTNRHKTRVKIAVKNRNEAELVDELTKIIKSALKISKTSYSLEKCAPLARKHGFLVDEDKEECESGKRMAKQIVNILKKENNLAKISKLLPLQGQLWHEWCKKERERTHLQDHENMGLEQQISQIHSAKQRIRKDQLSQVVPLNDLMQSFLTYLHSPSHKLKIYFLQWLKIFLDDLSIDHLPEHRTEYCTMWTQMQERENSNLHNKPEELSNAINESTFGLEHLLREAGQLYEALVDSTPQENQVVQFLPQIAADLMISGYPVELMDGAASHVPLKWVSAIFDKLVEKLGDKEVFVLSVLGVQSSGKSTFLNAMFGLQFRVSPGRCTKGVFMQLIKVADCLRPRLNFDFLLVVDTEGLRATELENRSMLNHDNELATFVIGLGNMTVINIFGENPTEMKDVLQIAVQAFLRMKQVNLSPSCLFVHQNVGEITTEEKNRESRRCTQKSLDEMTVTAAQQESCDVKCFSDVIHFDVNSHVHYFPHLWEGEPPMAPPNPSYSQKIQELKCRILTDAKEKSQQGFLRMSELNTRIQNLWEALLNETFVFSFKNSLEIAAYSSLENKYSKWSWELRRFMLDLQQKLNIQIQNDKSYSIERSFLKGSVQGKYESIMVEFEKYFCEDKHSKLIIQWKGKTKIKLDYLIDELVNATHKKCEELINLKQRQRLFEERKYKYKDELLRKSKEVAQEFREKDLSESELRNYFNGLWQQWITEVAPPVSHNKKPNIQVDMEHFLCDHFRCERDIKNRVKQSSEWTAFPVEASRFLFVKTLFLGENKAANKSRQEVTVQLERLVEEYIKKKEEEIMNYSPSYFHAIVKKLEEKISEDKHLKSSYRVDASLYLCQRAARKFTEMYEVFQRQNDPAIFLESQREDYFQSFVISCQGEKSITTFATFLCNQLEESICCTIYEKTALDVADEMKSEDPALSGNREKLERYLLIHLAEQENFEKYMVYIYDPSYYMGEFIRQRVDKYCLAGEKQILKNYLNSHLSGLKSLILDAINDSTRIVKDKGGHVSLWLDEFCSRIGDDLKLPRHTFSNIEHQEVKDIELIKEAVSDSLCTAFDHLEQAFANPDFEAFPAKPHEILLEQLCGCLKQCPFCKAVCTNTIPGHDGDHSTPFHRPQAIAGIQWEGTNHLVTDICSSLVASDSTFVLDGKKIPCKEYRKAGGDYAQWNIQPTMNTLCCWKWFVCHFRKELEDIHKGVFEGKGAIPENWGNLRKIYIIREIKFGGSMRIHPLKRLFSTSLT